jgi:hypothetical protein
VDADYSRKQPLRNKRLIRFIESVADERPFLPARQEALRFYEPFREENEWIRARFFPDQATLFDESFEHYPIEGSDQALSREDLERALVELWEFERNAPALPSNGVAEREQGVDKARAWAGRWVREAKAWWSPR